AAAHRRASRRSRDVVEASELPRLRAGRCGPSASAALGDERTRSSARRRPVRLPAGGDLHGVASRHRPGLRIPAGGERVEARLRDDDRGPPGVGPTTIPPHRRSEDELDLRNDQRPGDRDARDHADGEAARRRRESPSGRLDVTTPGAIRALAVLVSPALLGGCTASGPAIASLDTRSWQVEDYSTLGFTLRYPPQWHLQEFNQNLGMVGLAGVGVLNVNEQLRHPYYPNGTTTGWDMRRMPGDGVVVTVEYTATIMS